MKSLFFIEIPSHFPLAEDFSYCWYKKELTQESFGENPLSEIKEKTVNCEVILVLPGFNVLQSQIKSSLKNRKKLELAIAYELEEQLSEEIDQLFFAYQNTKEKSVLDVAVINRAWFEKWLELFRQQQIPLTAAITDLMLLQTISQESLLIKKPEYYLLKILSASYTVDNDNIIYFITKLKEALPDNLSVINYDNMPIAIADSIINSKLEKTDGNLLKVLTENYTSGIGINLLQGMYRPKLKNDWQLIKFSAIGLFSLLLIATGFQWYQHWKLSQQEAKLEEKREKIFRDSFPAVKKMVNPLVQMKNELEHLKQAQQQQGQFIGLLAKVAIALRDMIGQQKIHLSGFEFENNLLTLKFNASSLAMTEQVKQLLQQQQLTVEIESSDKAENQVNAVFKISGTSE
jgi:general secretion pathway protein L